MEDDQKRYVIIPKGTILHHYVTERNLGRDYRWYYLACQDYCNTAVKWIKKEVYIVKEDVKLLEYDLPYITNKITKQRIELPGIYNAKNYHSAQRGRPELSKNEIAAEIKSMITHESGGYSCYNSIDPIRGQYFMSSGNELSLSCIEYELVIPDRYVNLYEEKNLFDDHYVKLKLGQGSYRPKKKYHNHIPLPKLNFLPCKKYKVENLLQKGETDPITVIYDVVKDAYSLIDGNHRCFVRYLRGFKTIYADVTEGELTEIDIINKRVDERIKNDDQNEGDKLYFLRLIEQKKKD